MVTGSKMQILCLVILINNIVCLLCHFSNNSFIQHSNMKNFKHTEKAK